MTAESVNRAKKKLLSQNENIVYVTIDEMVAMIKDKFIDKAVSEDELQTIYKTVKGGFLLDKKLVSQNQNFQMLCSTGNRVTLFNLKDHNYIWIYAADNDTFYEYKSYFFGKLKRIVKTIIAEEKTKLQEK